MSKIIVLIATTVIALNLLYTMLPSGSYEKYCKYIFGLILVLVFAGTVTKFDISSQVLDFRENTPVFENKKIIETVQNQTELLICENIENMLKSKRIRIKSVSVTLENNELLQVNIKPDDPDRRDEIISLVSAYCDINKENIVIE